MVNSDPRKAFNFSFWAGIVSLLLIPLLGLSLSFQLSLGVIVLIYGLFVYKTTDGDKSAADSVYYLGFIFTLAALFVSLIPPLFGAQFTPENLFPAFSAALSSTLIGLTIRTYIVQNIEVHAAEAEEIQRRLIVATNDLVVNLRQVTIQLDETNKEISSSFSELTEQVSQATTGLTKKLNGLHLKVHSNLEKAAIGFQTSIEQTNNNATSAAKDFSKMVESSLSLCQSMVLEFQTGLSNSKETLSGVAESSEDFQKTFELYLSEFPKTVSESGIQSIDALKQIMDTRTDELNHSLNQGIEKIGNVLQFTLSNSLNKFAAFASDILKDSTAKLSAQMKKLEEATPNFDELALALNEAVKSIKVVGKVVDSLGSGSEKSLSEISRLSSEVRLLSSSIKPAIDGFGEISKTAKQITETTTKMESELQNAQKINSQLNQAILSGSEKLITSLEQNLNKTINHL